MNCSQQKLGTGAMSKISFWKAIMTEIEINFYKFNKNINIFRNFREKAPLLCVYHMEIRSGICLAKPI